MFIIFLVTTHTDLMRRDSTQSNCSCHHYSAGTLCTAQLHFSQSLYTVTVNETFLPEYPRPEPGFLTILCITPYPTLTYSIEYPDQSTTGLPFEINSTTGELTATQDIDYDSHSEGVDLYSFNVSCNDTVNRATALVEVYVNPINEFIPDIHPSLVLNITEATPSGTLLLSSLPGGLWRLVVEDMDAGVHGQLNFTLLTELDDHFTFDHLNANITLTRAVDFEERDSNLSDFLYHEMAVKIRVCDSSTPDEACPVIHFPIFIIASDDNYPMFLNDTYTVELNETTAAGASLLVMVCSDADVHIGEVQSISMLDPPLAVQEMFSLGQLSSDGSIDLVLAGQLDYDRLEHTYHFQVLCRDLLHSTTANVSISVLPENDEVPVFTSTQYQFSANQTTPIGTVIGQVTAVDGDLDSGLPVRYTILQLSDNAFRIDRVSGEIIVNDSLINLTASTALLLTISASDGDWETLVNVTVNITSENLHSPRFTDPHLESVTVPDSTPPGAAVHSMECTDEDSGTNGEIEYEILPQHHLFAVDTAGNVLVSMPLTLPDFRLSETHNISIQCRDKATPPLTATKTVTVTITKLDTQPPVVNLSNTSVSLPEDLPGGSHVLTLSVYDVDSPGVLVAVSNQTLLGTFVISPPATPSNHPHYPRLILNETLDREHISTHYIELLASSSTAPQQNISFSIAVTVQDINDNAPSCSEGKAVISAGVYVHRVLLSLSCSDPDKGLNQQLTYTLADIVPSLSEGHFNINRTSGELSVDGGIAARRYDITAVVSDQGIPPLTTRVHVDVEVTSDGGESPRVTLGIIIIFIVVVMIVLVGVASGCGLCCCYWHRVRADKKRRKYCVR